METPDVDSSNRPMDNWTSGQVHIRGNDSKFEVRNWTGWYHTLHTGDNMRKGWHRRDVLRVLGSMAASTAFPFSLRAADPPSAIMTTLSTYMSDAANRSLPQEAVEKTKHVIIDTLAAMIS